MGDWFGKTKIESISTLVVDQRDLKRLFLAYRDYVSLKEHYPKAFSLPKELEESIKICHQKYLKQIKD